MFLTIEKITKWKWFERDHFFAEKLSRCSVWLILPSPPRWLSVLNSDGNQSQLRQLHVHASCVCPDRTIRKFDECMQCPLLFFYPCSKSCLVFVASASQLPLCFFKPSQDNYPWLPPTSASLTYLPKDLVLTMLIIPQEHLCLIVVGMKELH